jgi:hypothetical protein
VVDEQIRNHAQRAQGYVLWWGLGEELIVVIPSLDLVIVRNGGQATANAAVARGMTRTGRRRHGTRAVPESDRRGDDAVSIMDWLPD